MSLPFLSDRWFVALEELLAKAGQPGPEPSDTVLNVTVTANPPLEIALQGGLFTRGHSPDAVATLAMPAETAYAFYVERDPTALMTGIYGGTVTIDGDLDAIAGLDSKRNPALQQCLDAIVAQTTAPGPRPSAAEKRAAYETAAANLTAIMKDEVRTARTKATAKAKPAATAKTKAKAKAKPSTTAKAKAKAKPSTTAKAKAKAKAVATAKTKAKPAATAKAKPAAAKAKVKPAVAKARPKSRGKATAKARRKA